MSRGKSGGQGNKLAMEELADRPEYCLDLVYMYVLLPTGYEFDHACTVKIEKKIEGPIWAGPRALQSPWLEESWPAKYRRIKTIPLD